MKYLYLLEQRNIKEREEEENRRKELLKKILCLLDELSKNVFFKSAYIFGSITKPFCFKESDVDIAFIGLSDDDFFNTKAYLSKELEIDVDVIQLEGHRLRNKIIKEGIKWTR